MTFTSDELILALVSLVRATRPTLLRQESDGFSIDFEAIANAESPRESDRLLLKLGALMQSPTEYPARPASPEGSGPAAEPPVSVELDTEESRQISDALASLERIKGWPDDVMDMSRAMRARLTPVQ